MAVATSNEAVTLVSLHAHPNLTACATIHAVMPWRDMKKKRNGEQFKEVSSLSHSQAAKIELNVAQLHCNAASQLAALPLRVHTRFSNSNNLALQVLKPSK